jgi:formylglycine-generating enzyme required for sulfatase activity
MKRMTLPALAFLLCAVAPHKPPVNFKKDFVPVGKTGLYISAFEVSNKQYRNFLQSLTANGESSKYHLAKVDTSLWHTKLAYGEPYRDYYYNHPAYDNYPVVNIGKQGAELYCEWLTEQYNLTAKRKAVFRLPTEQEWITAAKAGNESAIYPWQGNSLSYIKKGKWHGEAMCNYRQNKEAVIAASLSDNVDITAPVKSYLPNSFKIYNMSGNVAEMLQEDGFTKGGSWNSKAEKVTIHARETNVEAPVPSPQVGFRPVMVLL